MVSWATGNTSSCGTLTQAPPCLGADRTAATARCEALQSDLFAPCHASVDPQPFIDDCIDDYCVYCDEANRDDFYAIVYLLMHLFVLLLEYYCQTGENYIVVS